MRKSIRQYCSLVLIMTMVLTFLTPFTAGESFAAGAAVNLALEKHVVEDDSNKITADRPFVPSNAVDGDPGTRWNSVRSANHWIYVDLGSKHLINKVVIDWATAYATSYKIEVSDNPASVWEEVYSVTNDNTGKDIIEFGSVQARYVRMYGITPQTIYGFSLYEFEVYGPADAIVAVEPLTDIFVQKGSEPGEMGLPSTVTAMYGDGRTESAAVEWSTAGLDLNTAGTYDLVGAVAGSAVEAQINVEVVESSDITFNVTDGTDPLEDAEVSVGEAVYRTGTSGVGEFNLGPGEYSFTAEKEGYYTVSGNFTVEDTNITIPVVLQRKPAEDAVFEGFDPISDITVFRGMAIESIDLPSVVRAVYSDGTKVYTAVEWDTGGLDLYTEGEYTLEGTVAGLEEHPTVIVRVENSTFDVIRLKYSEFLTGGTSIHPTDEDINAKIAEIDAATQNYLDSMNSSGAGTNIWSDLSMTERTGSVGSYEMTNTFLRLGVMATAYRTEGSAFEGDTALRDKIINALTWMNTNIYNTSASWGNWWDWQIGAPIEILKTLTLMYDELPRELLAKYVSALKTQVPLNTSNTPGDANVMWIKFNNVLTGVIANDESIVNTAMTALSNGFFQYKVTGDGFYTDGSYVMHGGYAYTGSYGTSLIETLAKVIYLTEGSPWEIGEDNKQVVFKWVKETFAPVIYKGIMMDMVRGRVISRETEQDHMIGHVVARSILLISQAAPPEIALEFKGMVKYWAREDTYRSIYEGENVVNNNNSVYFINKIKEVENNPAIIPMEDPEAHYRFPAMDRVVHATPGYAFGISMHSNRISNYESISGANLRGWHTGDGMTYLYNGDQGQFSKDFWPTVNSYRLPGTTVNKDTMIAASKKNGSNWVGGADILGKYGITGMELMPSGKTLHAKKSWFMFDDEIVALGSDIFATDGTIVESIVENRKIKPDGSNALMVDGQAKPSDTGWSEAMGDVKWVSLEGNVGGADIGYYFPGGANINGLRESRTGKWIDIEANPGMSSNTEYTENYLNLWFDHGTDPVNASYSYVLLPNKGAVQVSSYVSNPDISILENSSEAQAVKENNLNIVGVNFWKDVPKTVDFITSDKKASVMTKETAGDIEVSVSDPTQANTGVINIELDRSAGYIISTDANITVTQVSPTIRFTVNTQNLKGKASKIKFGHGSTIPASTGITLDQSEMIMDLTQTGILRASVTSEIPGDQPVIWSSSDPTVATVSAGGMPARLDGIITPLKTGSTIITATTYDGRHHASCVVGVHEPSNYAYMKNAVEDVRSTAGGDAALLPSCAVDGNPATRWASARSNNHWLYVDLGYEHIVDRVVLNWEAGYGKEYRIEVASDLTEDNPWKEVYSTIAGDGGIDDIGFPEEKARYVRMNGQVRNGNYSFSLWEFEVYGPDDAILTIKPSNDIRVNKGTSAEAVGLPSVVTAVYNNGLPVQKPAGWDTSSLDLDTIGEYVLEGTVEGTDIKAAVKIIVTAHKTALAARISEAQELQGESYTEASWVSLQNAITAALAANENLLAPQEVVDEALANLEAAIAGLRTRSSGGGGGGPSSPVVKEPKPEVQNDGTVKVVTKPSLDKGSNTAVSTISTDLMEKALEQAERTSGGARVVIFEIPETQGAAAYNLQLPANALSSGEDVRIEIATPLGTIAAPGNMFNSSDLRGENIELTIGLADRSEISEDIRQQIGDRPVIELNASVDGQAINWNNPDAPVTVSIDYTPTAEELKDPEHIVVWYIDGQGNVVSVPNGRYDPASGKVIFTTTHFSKYAVAFVKKTFSDIGNYSWAKKQIEVLASRGVINGTTATTYSPGQNITRADFITLLVRALELKADFSTNFDDAKPSAHYYNALGTARALGIATGVGNNKFNPGEPISRQDMMVLVARAMKIAGKASATGTFSDIVGFTDASEVSSHAVEGVATLVKEGIIQGNNNRINPKDTATRAETAVIIYRIFNK